MSDPAARVSGSRGPRHAPVLRVLGCRMSGILFIISAPSGSGKSTLMNLMTGLLRPSQGSISVLGVAPDAVLVAHRDHLQRVREVVGELKARGHDVVTASSPWGGAQTIKIDWDRGVLIAGSELPPRARPGRSPTSCRGSAAPSTGAISASGKVLVIHSTPSSRCRDRAGTRRPFPPKA